MSAYVIFDVEITDPNLYESYKKLTPSIVEAYGGKFIVRGGKTETIEGNWEPGRFVMLEFPDMDKAKAWWHSEAYGKAKAIRQKAAKTQMIMVEG